MTRAVEELRPFVPIDYLSVPLRLQWFVSVLGLTGIGLHWACSGPAVACSGPDQVGPDLDPEQRIRAVLPRSLPPASDHQLVSPHHLTPQNSTKPSLMQEESLQSRACPVHFSMLP